MRSCAFVFFNLSLTRSLSFLLTPSSLCRVYLHENQSHNITIPSPTRLFESNMTIYNNKTSKHAYTHITKPNENHMFELYAHNKRETYDCSHTVRTQYHRVYWVFSDEEELYCCATHRERGNVKQWRERKKHRTCLNVFVVHQTHRWLYWAVAKISQQKKKQNSRQTNAHATLNLSECNELLFDEINSEPHKQLRDTDDFVFVYRSRIKPFYVHFWTQSKIDCG